MSQVTPKRKIGRPPVADRGRSAQAYLYTDDLARAFTIGEGNVSFGIRRALNRCNARPATLKELPAAEDAGRVFQAYLYAEDLAKALELGEGNISLGIRRALFVGMPRVGTAALRAAAAFGNKGVA